DRAAGTLDTPYGAKARPLPAGRRGRRAPATSATVAEGAAQRSSRLSGPRRRRSRPSKTSRVATSIPDVKRPSKNRSTVNLPGHQADDVLRLVLSQVAPGGEVGHGPELRVAVGDDAAAEGHELERHVASSSVRPGWGVGSHA